MSMTRCTAPQLVSQTLWIRLLPFYVLLNGCIGLVWQNETTRVLVPVIEMPYASVNNSMYIFGGIEELGFPGIYTRKIQEFSNGAFNVLLEETPSNQGAWRCNSQCASAIDGHRILFVGACNPGDIQIFDITTKQFISSNTHNIESAPIRVYEPCVAADILNQKVYISGGYNDLLQNLPFNILQILNLVTKSWTIQNMSIAGRWGHSCAYHADYYYLFGGATTSKTEFMNEQFDKNFYRYNVNFSEWFQISIMGHCRFLQCLSAMSDTRFQNARDNALQDFSFFTRKK
eukprot:163697_1